MNTLASNPGQTHAASRRAWIGLAVLGLPTLLLAIDLSVVYLALPRMSRDLDASGAQQLWITDIYGFVTAGFLVTMGTLGDRIGRRRLLLIGAASFGAASVLAAYSTSAAMLIAARAVMGLAGATLMPSTLALITNMFRDPRERAAAIAAWTSCFVVGAALGPLVGGVLLEHFWWGSLFLLGVPVMLLLLVTGPYLLPEFRDAAAGRIDLASVLLSLVAVLPVVYAIKELATDGWSLLSVAAAAGGVVAGIVFFARQRWIANPLLDVRLFHNRAFSTALFILMIGLAAQSGTVLLLSEYLQIVLKLPPLRAGLLLMPASAAMVVGCILAPVVARAVRQSRIIAAGLAITAAGYLVLASIGGAGASLVVGTILVYFGIGPMAVFSQDLIVGSAPPEKAGSAAALSEASGDFGIALGVAVLGSISAAVYGSRVARFASLLPQDAADVARESLTGAADVATRLPDPLARELQARTAEAFTSGLHVVAIGCAAASIGLALLTVTFIGPIDRPSGHAGRAE